MKNRIATLAIAAILLFIASSTVSTSLVVTAAPTDPSPTSHIRVQDGPQVSQTTISWDVVPSATHYRICYVNMDDFRALQRYNPTASWRQTIKFAELKAGELIASNGRMEFTVDQLEPGVPHAFTVLTSNQARWDSDVVSGAFVWPKNPTWITYTPRAQPNPVPVAATTTTSPPAWTDPTPEQYQDAKRYMVQLINEERAKVNAPPVTLGDNSAAQLHADDMYSQCFISHWGADGLKPHMRYTLTGGQQANSENVAFNGNCFRTFNTRRTPSQIVDIEMYNLMNSPGHRKAILNPHHSKVNIGIAGGIHSHSVVQLFEHNYVTFTQPPVIQGTLLTIAGTAHIPRQAGEDVHLSIRVNYHPPPHALTNRQLASSASYNYGTTIALIDVPGDPRWQPAAATTSQITIPHARYPNPYDAPAEPPLRDQAEMRQLKKAARQASSNPRTEQTTVFFIEPAQRDIDIDGPDFAFTVDIAPVLERFGPGVYTIVLSSGLKMISVYSIFHGVTPPDKYAAAAATEETEP